MIEKLSERERTGLGHLRQAAEKTALKRQRTFAWVQIAEAASPTTLDSPVTVSAAPMARHIVHPFGWAVDCGTFPQASWLATVLAGQCP